MEQVFPGVYRWTVWNEKISDAMGCFWLEGPDDGVAIDPAISSDEDWNTFETRGPLRAIVLTTSHHERQSAGFRERLGAPIWAPAGSEASLELTPDHVYRDGDMLPGGLLAVASPQVFAAWEHALYLSRESGENVLFLGDALVNFPSTGLSLLPAKYGGPTDPADVRRGLTPLLALEFDAVLVSHGDLVLSGARETIRALLPAEE